MKEKSHGTNQRNLVLLFFFLSLCPELEVLSMFSPWFLLKTYFLIPNHFQTCFKESYAIDILSFNQSHSCSERMKDAMILNLKRTVEHSSSSLLFLLSLHLIKKTLPIRRARTPTEHIWVAPTLTISQFRSMLTFASNQPTPFRIFASLLV